MTYDEIRQAILEGALVHLERMNKEVERSTRDLSEQEIEDIKKGIKLQLKEWLEKL